MMRDVSKTTLYRKRSNEKRWPGYSHRYSKTGLSKVSEDHSGSLGVAEDEE